jgi:hypothetical protein
MIIDLEDTLTAYLAARLNAPQLSTGSRIRAATPRLAHVRQHQKVLPSGCQNRNDTVVGLGWSSFKLLTRSRPSANMNVAARLE